MQFQTYNPTPIFKTIQPASIVILLTYLYYQSVIYDWIALRIPGLQVSSMQQKILFATCFEFMCCVSPSLQQDEKNHSFKALKLYFQAPTNSGGVHICSFVNSPLLLSLLLIEVVPLQSFVKFDLIFIDTNTEDRRIKIPPQQREQHFDELRSSMKLARCAKVHTKERICTFRCH